MAGPQLPPGYRLATPAPPSLPPGYRLAPTQTPVQPRPSPTPAFGIGGPASTRLLSPNANGPKVEYANQPNEIPIPETDPYGRALSLGVQGVGRGAANLAGAPFDMTNALLNIPLTVANRVFDGQVPYLPTDTSEKIAAGATDLAEGAGVKVFDREEMTDQERLGYDISNYGTQGAVAGASMALPGTQAAAAATPSLLGTIFRGLTRPYSDGREVFVDTAAGVGAGVGNNLLEEHFPNAGPLAQAGANIGGGIGGAGVGSLVQGLLTQIPRAMRSIFGETGAPIDPMTGNQFGQGALDRAAERVQRAARGEDTLRSIPAFTQGERNFRDMAPRRAAAEIEEQANTFGAGPQSGIPTSGLISGNTGLVGAENRARLANPDQFIRADQGVNSAARAEVDSLAPGADGRQFTDTIAMQQEGRVGEARGGVAAAEEQLATANRTRSGEAAELAMLQNNSRFRDQAVTDIDRAVVNEAMLPTLDRSSARYAAVDRDRQAVIDVEPLVAAATAVRSQLGTLATPNKVIPQGLLARIEGLVDPEGAAPPQTTVRDLVDVIPEIGNTMQRARQAGNWPLVDSLRTLRTSIEGMLEEAAGVEPPLPRRAMPAGARPTPVQASPYGEVEVYTALETQFPGFFDEIGDHIAEVPAGSLRATQPFIFDGAVSTNDRPMVGIRLSDGTVHLVDGHHRAAQAVESGAQTVPVAVFDLPTMRPNEPTGPTADAARGFVAARQGWREEVAPVYSRGRGDPASDLRRDVNLDRANRSNTPPSATIGRFAQPAAPEKMASLNRVLETTQNPEQAREAVRTFMLSDLAMSGVLDTATQALRPNSLMQWRQAWGSTLDQIPASRGSNRTTFAEEIDDMIDMAQQGERLTGGLAEAVNAARRNLTDAQVNTGALGLVLGHSPPNAIRDILGSADPETNMRALVDELGGNLPATEGLKAAVREYLIDKATQPAAGYKTLPGDGAPVSFAKLSQLFNEHENILSMVYSPTEMNRLRLAHGRLNALANRAQGATVGSQTAARWNSLLTGVESIARPIYGQLQTGGIMRTLRLWGEQMPSSAAAADRLVGQMYFNPELATMLLTRDVRAGTPAWNSRLNQLLGAAEGVREGDQQQ